MLGAVCDRLPPVPLSFRPHARPHSHKLFTPTSPYPLHASRAVSCDASMQLVVWVWSSASDGSSGPASAAAETQSPVEVSPANSDDRSTSVSTADCDAIVCRRLSYPL